MPDIGQGLALVVLLAIGAVTYYIGERRAPRVVGAHRERVNPPWFYFAIAGFAVAFGVVVVCIGLLMLASANGSATGRTPTPMPLPAVTVQP